MSFTQPTNDQIAAFTRLAADLPPEDIARQLYIIQEQGPQTAGAAVLRRAIAEILALRAMVRKVRNGELNRT